MEKIEKSAGSRNNLIRTYDIVRKNLNTRYLNSQVIKNINIFKSDNIVNKGLNLDNIKFNNFFNHSKEKKDKNEETNKEINNFEQKKLNKLLKIKGKLPVLKTGKMIRNEKMPLDKLVRSVNDKEDYDYLVKEICKSSAKKVSRRYEDEDRMIKDKISFFHERKREETKTISFNKRLLNPSKLKTSNENFNSTSTIDTKHSLQNSVKYPSSTKVSLPNDRYINNLKSNKTTYLLTKENINLEYQNNKKFLLSRESNLIYNPIKIYSSGLKVENEIKRAKGLLESLKKIMNF